MKSLRLISLILVIVVLSVCELKSQLKFADVYGNQLPTPSWPPPDSFYVPNTITVWFNSNVINKEFLCNYWNYIHNPPIIKESLKDKLLTSQPTGCFDINYQLIADSSLVQALISLGASQMCQYTTFSPCVDTLSYTRNGDTIRTPEFWNCFYITLDSNIAVEAVQLLTIFYGGRQIDYAELSPIVTPDGCTNSQNTPGDQYWYLEQNYHNGFNFENVCDAWDFEHGIRGIRVAVIDDGIDYTNHADLQGNICPTCRIVDGREWNLGGQNHLRRPPTNGGGHGTPIAGLIGALVNNEGVEVAGIAGGWNTTEGVSLIDMKTPNLSDYDRSNAWIEAAASTSGNQGFGVHIISNSNGNNDYNETMRRALDYAYRSGVTCFASKGNYDARYHATDYQFHCPGDFEYYKIIDVGSYGIDVETNSIPTNYVPTRSNHKVPYYPSNQSFVSYYGFGLDLLAQGDHYYPDNLRNCTLQDGGGVRWFSYTSAACPQVAGVGALMLSNYSRNPNPNFDPIVSEDVQGLLCISAMDCRYTYNQRRYNQNGIPQFFTDQDTVGYDAQTGYGILKADVVLQYMQQPCILKHFTATGGTSVANQQVDNFIVLQPTYGTLYYLQAYRGQENTGLLDIQFKKNKEYQV